MGALDVMQGVEPINSYAVVFYAAGPLAKFLDDLRSELEPGHPVLRSHVTVLPPRELSADPEEALSQLRRQSGEFNHFHAVLGGIRTFAGTNVVYLSVANGFDDLQRMHRRLNQNALEFAEPYPYHPHITLAQGLPPERVQGAFARARECWDAYQGPRHFLCQSMYFVRGTSDAKWIDLAEVRLR